MIEIAKKHGLAHLPISKAISCRDKDFVAYTNEIIEMCAKPLDDRDERVGHITNEFSMLGKAIRDLKVKE